MNARSPWALVVADLFHGQDLPAIFQHELCGYHVSVHTLNNALWIRVICPRGAQVILRPAYAPADHLQVGKLIHEQNGLSINLSSTIGRFKVTIQFPDREQPIIRYTTTFTPAAPLLMPYWPRDMIITGPDDSDMATEGTIYISQAGTRSGLQYFSIDKLRSGAVLYFQNFTALNDYARLPKLR
jgi:hypothetical protein